MSFPKSSGDALLSSEANSMYNSVALYNQSIDVSVSVGDPVYFDGSEWQIATSQNAVGVYADNNIVVTHGYVGGLSGLTANTFYYLETDGSLITTPAILSTMQKIGYAISTTELIVNINEIEQDVNDLGFSMAAGGSGLSQLISFFYIKSGGNVLSDGISFGSSTTAGATSAAAVGNRQRILKAGGGGASPFNVIDYVVANTKGNATDFGDLTVARSNVTGFGSDSRGIFSGGVAASDVYQNVLDYITFNAAGNATDFGNLTVTRSTCGGASSTTRGISYGGYDNNPNYSNVIDYVTIASAGNATDFGDTTTTNNYWKGGSSNTRAVFFSASGSLKNIDYITIATTGNGTDFGDCSYDHTQSSVCSSHVKAVVGSSYLSNNTMEYILIASLSDASDFGDLGRVSGNSCSASNCHGGLA